MHEWRPGLVRYTREQVPGISAGSTCEGCAQTRASQEAGKESTTGLTELLDVNISNNVRQRKNCTYAKFRIVFGIAGARLSWEWTWDTHRGLGLPLPRWP